MKKFEIFTGKYNLGQGYHQGELPEKVGEETAINFTVACIKHELKERLRFIELMEHRDDKTESIISVGLKFELDLKTLSQPWIGKYYDSKESAIK